MGALAGCTRCGYVEPTNRGEINRDCPACGFPLREVDRKTARRLSRELGNARSLRARVREQMSRFGR